MNSEQTTQMQLENLFFELVPPAMSQHAVAYGNAVMAIVYELASAKRSFPSTFNNPHEGYAVLLEEVDELWEEVKRKRGERSAEKMRLEAIQVAAMALRFAAELT